MNMRVVKELLEWQLGDIEKSISYHVKYNQPWEPFGGSFTEMLHAVMYDTRCTGSGGSGWDTADNGESKYSSRVQSRKCTYCGSKVMFFMDSCVECNSYNLGNYPKDSRFGIAGKSHLEYFEDLKGYRVTLLEPETYDPSCRTFRLRSWFIETKNEYLTEYAVRQVNSKKSNGINFMPLGQDFYRCSPCLHLDATITTNGVNIEYFDVNNTVPERGPEKFYVKSMEEIMDRKTFGKERGDVSRK